MRYRLLYIKKNLKIGIYKWFILRKRFNDFLFLRIFYNSFGIFFNLSSLRLKNRLLFINMLNYPSSGLFKVKGYSSLSFSNFCKKKKLNVHGEVFFLPFLNFFFLIGFNFFEDYSFGSMFRFNIFFIFLPDNILLGKSKFSSSLLANCCYVLDRFKFFKCFLKNIFVLLFFILKYLRNLLIFNNTNIFTHLLFLNFLIFQKRKIYL